MSKQNKNDAKTDPASRGLVRADPNEKHQHSQQSEQRIKASIVPERGSVHLSDRLPQEAMRSVSVAPLWLPVRPSTLNLDSLVLAVISPQQSAKGKVLIQVWPVNTEGRNFHPPQLFRCSTRQARVAGHGKANDVTAFHLQNNLAIPEKGRSCAIG